MKERRVPCRSLSQIVGNRSSYAGSLNRPSSPGADGRNVADGAHHGGKCTRAHHKACREAGSLSTSAMGIIEHGDHETRLTLRFDEAMEPGHVPTRIS